MWWVKQIKSAPPQVQEEIAKGVGHRPELSDEFRRSGTLAQEQNRQTSG